MVEIDGHDIDAISGALSSLPAQDGKPTMVIAHTVKGSGVPMLEGKKKSHYVTLTPPLYARASAGLRNRARRTR